MFAVEWAVGNVAGVKSFGLIPHIMHQALKARDDAQHAEEAQREAEARVDEQRRREREERDRRRRLADRRASLSDEALAALRHRAEEALAADVVARTRLGYEVLVKLTMDDLLEQACVWMPVSADGAHPSAAVTASR